MCTTIMHNKMHKCSMPPMPTQCLCQFQWPGWSQRSHPLTVETHTNYHSNVLVHHAYSKMWYYGSLRYRFLSDVAINSSYICCHVKGNHPHFLISHGIHPTDVFRGRSCSSKDLLCTQPLNLCTQPQAHISWSGIAIRVLDTAPLGQVLAQNH